jgi:hypothetical protein
MEVICGYSRQEDRLSQQAAAIYEPFDALIEGISGFWCGGDRIAGPQSPRNVRPMGAGTVHLVGLSGEVKNCGGSSSWG